MKIDKFFKDLKNVKEYLIKNFIKKENHGFLSVYLSSFPNEEILKIYIEEAKKIKLNRIILTVPIEIKTYQLELIIE